MDSSDNRPIPNSYWVIPGRFLAGAYPAEYDRSLTRSKMTAFLNAGFDTFFNLTGENELPAYQPTLMDEAVFYDRQVFHERFSITDKGLPSRTSMITILDAIDQSLASGHKLYLHCWGGIGRTGTTVGCFLVRHGLSGQAALHKLASLYRTAAQSKLYPNSPETREQIDFILNWHES
ncbi:MAG: hypothetical protein A2X25_11695 [Chloroflexi bacterium GWB2_49_20]|nr:MAG: hypothetical protein A2X25_11695 [Chloroflexi bacterium GWB2_49_20]OGN77671.1 MAG: hypothetical protein A2X26_09965 [Chloroflexi bacterium GWC2_49_37]OGN86447.1 MAG: hypothetical protein A2X27_06120 [Chloroflexi bacterium GWD2_49_16]HBG74688.1 hypothetical protein [Anaerolineae bacterium]